MIFVDNLLERRWRTLAGRQLRNSGVETEWNFLQTQFHHKLTNVLIFEEFE